jgi:hypothetical protein
LTAPSPAVQYRGHDFEFKGQRHQVKANRRSGKPGSVVTLVPKAKNFDWDVLIWISTTKITKSKKRGHGIPPRIDKRLNP